jgi:hypothetical protein
VRRYQLVERDLDLHLSPRRALTFDF